MGHVVGGLNVSIVTGCVVKHDAVSNIVRQQAEALARPAGTGAVPAKVRVFASGGDVADSRQVDVWSAGELAAHPHFLASDLIVFHFGIRYTLFDAIHLAPRTARVLGYYHGITPPSLCTGPTKLTTAESFRQANHLHAADRVLVTSRFMTEELLKYGLPAEKIERVPPCVAFAPAPRAARAADAPVRFVYVGRFVKPKGVVDLVKAFAKFAAGHPDGTLDLAGSATFSDPAVLADLKSEVARHDLGDRVTLHLDLPSDELAELLAASDVFVLPSLHEGFGVPIVEALASGCYVICSDAGACPDTAGGLGTVFPAKDIDALATAMNAVAEAFAAGVRPTTAGPLPAAAWAKRATAYAATFGRAAFEGRFRAACLGGLPVRPAGLRTFFADARKAVVEGMRFAPPAADADRVYGKFWRLLPQATAAARLRAAA